MSDNGYFENGNGLAIKKNPLEIIAGYNVKGKDEANSELDILPFKIIPPEIYERTLDEAEL